MFLGIYYSQSYNKTIYICIDFGDGDHFLWSS